MVVRAPYGRLCYRGVLVRFIDSKGSVLNYNYETMAPGTPPQSSYKGGTTQSSSKGHSAQATPQFRAGGYHEMGKKYVPLHLPLYPHVV